MTHQTLEDAMLVCEDTRPLEGGTVMISPLFPVCPTTQTQHQAVVDPHAHMRRAGHMCRSADTHPIYQTIPTSQYSY